MSSSTRRTVITAGIVVALVAAALLLRGIVHHDNTTTAHSPQNAVISPSAPPRAPLPSVPDGPDPSTHQTVATTTTAQPSTTASAPARFPQPFAAIDPTDPIAVLQAATETIFTYQPDRDSTQKDAALRAAALIAAPGVDDGFATLAPITGKQWRRWADAHATVHATAIVPAVNDNPDTPTAVSRAVTITQDVIGPDRQPAPEKLTPITAYCTARKQPDGTWRLSKIAVS